MAHVRRLLSKTMPHLIIEEVIKYRLRHRYISIAYSVCITKPITRSSASFMCIHTKQDYTQLPILHSVVQFEPNIQT